MFIMHVTACIYIFFCVTSSFISMVKIGKICNNKSLNRNSRRTNVCISIDMSLPYSTLKNFSTSDLFFFYSMAYKKKVYEVLSLSMSLHIYLKAVKTRKSGTVFFFHFILRRVSVFVCIHIQ